MKIEDILSKKQTTMKDQLAVLLVDMVERLHDVCSEEDLLDIKHNLCKVWRKHYPLSTLLSNKPTPSKEKVSK